VESISREEALSAAGAAGFVGELSGALELSHDGDAAVYLLNPRVLTANGEREAWFLATWSPEVERFPSFQAMMQSRYRAFHEHAGFGF
jgi:hypothetical protein